MPKNALDFLREMPHGGHLDSLVSACEALGFSVQPTSDGILIEFGGASVARIQDGCLSVDMGVANQLNSGMPAPTREQEETFNLVLVKLERNEIAVHEAGHAIAAHVLGLKCTFVRIDPEGEMKLCADDDADSFDESDDEKSEAMQEVYAAGAAAEELLFGKYRRHGMGMDARDVNVMEIMKIQAETGQPPEQCDVFDQYLRRVKARLVKAQVIAVANALKEKGSLSGEEVESILRASGSA